MKTSEFSEQRRRSLQRLHDRPSMRNNNSVQVTLEMTDGLRANVDACAPDLSRYVVKE